MAALHRLSEHAEQADQFGPLAVHRHSELAKQAKCLIRRDLFCVTSL